MIVRVMLATRSLGDILDIRIFVSDVLRLVGGVI